MWDWLDRNWLGELLLLLTVISVVIVIVGSAAELIKSLVQRREAKQKEQLNRVATDFTKIRAQNAHVLKPLTEAEERSAIAQCALIEKQQEKLTILLENRDAIKDLDDKWWDDCYNMPTIEPHEEEGDVDGD